MIKYQEALENLRLLDCVDEENFEMKFEILPILQELVDKATPKKPKRKLIESEDLWSETVTIVGIDICDNCKKQVQNSRKFCDECGQAIDWSEDDYPHR